MMSSNPDKKLFLWELYWVLLALSQYEADCDSKTIFEFTKSILVSCPVYAEYQLECILEV